MDITAILGILALITPPIAAIIIKIKQPALYKKLGSFWGTTWIGIMLLGGLFAGTDWLIGEFDGTNESQRQKLEAIEVRQKEELQLLSPYFENFGMGCTCLEYYDLFMEKNGNVSSTEWTIRAKCGDGLGKAIQLAKIQGNTKAVDKMTDMNERQFYKKVCDYEK